MPDARFPPPPNYRSRRGRMVSTKFIETDPTTKVLNNVSVPPRVHTNGIGVRTTLEIKTCSSSNVFKPESFPGSISSGKDVLG